MNDSLWCLASLSALFIHFSQHHYIQFMRITMGPIQYTQAMEKYNYSHLIL